MIFCRNCMRIEINMYDAVRYITSSLNVKYNLIQYNLYIKLLLVIIIHCNIDNLPFDESALGVIAA